MGGGQQVGEVEGQEAGRDPAGEVHGREGARTTEPHGALRRAEQTQRPILAWVSDKRISRCKTTWTYFEAASKKHKGSIWAMQNGLLTERRIHCHTRPSLATKKDKGLIVVTFRLAHA